MDTINALKEVFDLLSQPVFFAREQTIEYCNYAATRSMICEGEPLSRYLSEAVAACITGDEPLHLPLTAAGRSSWATVRPFDGGMLFVLEADDSESLRADALLPLSNAVNGPLTELLTAMKKLLPLLDESEDATFRRGAAALRHGTYRLLRVGKNLPAMRDVLTDEDVICRTKGDLRDLLSSLREKAAPLLAPTGIMLRCELPEEPVDAWFDQLRLRRALLNLLSNAARFTSRGGEITLRLDTIGDYARITVEDTGRGFDPDVLASAFRRYDRRIELEAYEWGVGFGLPIARSIAENHGGTILIRSAPGRGASVYLTVKLGLPPRDQTVSTVRTQYDYTGGLPAEQFELSDALPLESYENRK